MQGFCEEFANGTKEIFRKKICFEGQDGRTYEADSLEICRALTECRQNESQFCDAGSGSGVTSKQLTSFYRIIGEKDATIRGTDNFKRHDAMEVFLKNLGRYLKGDENAFIHAVERDMTPVLHHAENIGECKQDPIKSAKKNILRICGELAKTGYYYKYKGVEDLYKGYIEYIHEVRLIVSACKTICPKRVEAINRILDETEMMVGTCDIPNVCDRWLEANPRLKFYDCVFEFHRENPELYRQIANGEKPVRFRFNPTDEEFKAEEKYHAEVLALRQEKHETEEEQYQREVITAVENLFEQDLT